jgi:hypothetical protein
VGEDQIRRRRESLVLYKKNSKLLLHRSLKEQLPNVHTLCAEILEQSMGATYRVRIGVSYLLAWLHRRKDSIPCNRFLWPFKV